MQSQRNIIVLFLCCFSLSILRCSFSDGFTSTVTETTGPNDNHPIYKFKKRYFVLVPSDTALLSGTRICTLITNGALTSIQEDSTFFRTITSEDTTLTLDNKPYTVSPQVYQTGTSLSTLSGCSIIRYFKQNDTAILQLAYEKQGTIHTLESNIRKVMPVSIEVGDFDSLSSSANTWQSVPLIPLPNSIGENLKHITGFTVASNAMAIHPLAYYVVNGYRYRDGVKFKSYYSVFYEDMVGSIPVTILKKIEMIRYYFKEIGLVEQKIYVLTQKLGTDGSVEIRKEHFIFQRGPEGAPKYADWQS